MYHTFASLDATTKAVAGLVYESLGHSLLEEGMTLTFKTNDEEPTAKACPSEIPRRGAGAKFYGRGQPRDIRILSAHSCDHIRGQSRRQSSLTTCMCPRQEIKVALDSFFQLDAIFYIFPIHHRGKET